MSKKRRIDAMVRIPFWGIGKWHMDCTQRPKRFLHCLRAELEPWLPPPVPGAFGFAPGMLGRLGTLVLCMEASVVPRVFTVGCCAGEGNATRAVVGGFTAAVTVGMRGVTPT